MENNNSRIFSDEEIKGMINYMLDAELSKPYQEMDDSFVAECVDFLMEIDGVQVNLTKKEIDSRVNSIIEAADTAERKKRRTGIKKFALVAACIALLSLSISFVAFGSDTVVDTLSEIIKHLKPGEGITVDGMDIVKPYYSIRYNSVQELQQSENVRVLYPTYLPDGAEIVSILFSIDKTTSSSMFAIPDSAITFRVLHKSHIPQIVIDDCSEVAEIYAYKCYLFYDDDYVQAQFEYNGDVYAIEATNYNEINDIIRGLREID